MLRLFSGPIAAVALAFLYPATPGIAQSLCLPTIGTLGRLASPGDIVVAGSHAVVADRFAGLVIVDISIPSDPLQVCTLWIPSADRVEVAGERAYVTDREAMHIIDISRPRTPVEIGKMWLGEATSALAVGNGVAFVGNRTWGASWEGLKILDVSDPIRPTWIGSMEFSFGIANLTARDDLLYVGAPSDGLVVLDVSDPSNPEQIGSYDPRGGVLSFDLSGELAFVGTSFDLRVIDISDPTQPAEIGVYDPGWNVGNVRVSDGLAVLQLVDDEFLLSKIQLVDVSDPRQPLLLFDDLGSFGFANEIAVSGGRAYLASLSGGVRIHDLFDATALEEIGRLDPPPIRAVTCHAGGAYTIGYDSEWVEIAAVPASSDPFPIGSYRAPGDIWDFQILGERAYAAVPEIGVIVLDISHPGRMTEVATVVPSIEPRGIEVSDTTLYVKSWDAIEILDISNPSAAVPRGRYDFELDHNFELGSAAVSGGVLLVGVLNLEGRSSNELWIFDVSDPDYPAPVSVTEIPTWSVEDIEIVGDHAFVAIHSFGLVVFDVAHPESPRLVGSHEMPIGTGEPAQVSVRDGLALMTTSGFADAPSLIYFNASDPGHPAARGGQFVDRDIWSLSLMDGRACLVLDSSQVVILDLDRPSTCPAPRQPSGRSIPVDARRSKAVFVEREITRPKR